MGPPFGVRLTYTQGASFARDHRDYFVHGGGVVGLAMEANLQMALWIEVPEAEPFHLMIRTGQAVPTLGTIVTFEPAEQPERDRMRAWCEAFPDEPAAPGIDPPRVTWLADSTPPGSAPAIDAAASPPDSESESASEDVVYTLKYSTLRCFWQARSDFETGWLSIPMREEALTVGATVQVKLQLPGRNIFELWGTVETIEATRTHLRLLEDQESLQDVLRHLESRAARIRLQGEEERDDPMEPPVVRRLEIQAQADDDLTERLPIRQRLRRMTMEEKINLALSGDREMRMALAGDTNRAIHPYLLKNAKITINEIAHLARLPTTNPDVLERIADNPQYIQNSAVVKSLVFNPKTSISTSVRLLDRLPRGDLIALSKRTTMHHRLVMAAKKKLGVS
ncbi:MAG: hypothetical protein ACFB9M_08665 [Myxococcota bacterium]